MKQILAKEDVERAMADLSAKGRKTTLAALHAALDHRGSMSTLIRLKAEIEAPPSAPHDSEEALNAFRQLWNTAQEDARKQQRATIADLQETLKMLATENERLDGVAAAAERRCAELEQAKSAAETEALQIRGVAPVRLCDGFATRQLGSATTKRSGDSNEIEPVILVGY